MFVLGMDFHLFNKNYVVSFLQVWAQKMRTCWYLCWCDPQVRKGHDEITQQDFVEVLDKQLFEGMGVVLMDEEQREAEQKVLLGSVFLK